MKGNHKKIIALLLLIALLISVRLLGIDKYLTFENFILYRDQLLRFVQEHYFVSVLIFVITYIIIAALSIPGGAVLTISGGFLFGLIGVLYVNIGATIGATVAFVLARYILGDWIQNKYREKLSAFNREIDENGRNYLLVLRLIPIFPFFLINFFAGLTRIPIITFVWTTALGIIPGSFVYCYAGTQLGSIKNVSDIMSWRIVLIFVFFGVLAFIPVVIKKIKNRD